MFIMNTKQIILTFTMLVLFSFTGLSQVRRYSQTDTFRSPQGNITSSFEIRITEGAYQDRVESLQSQKVAFFSTYIEFTIKEAEAFWPLYNEYTNKLNAIYDKQNKLRTLLISMSERRIYMEDQSVKKNLDEYVQCGNSINSLNLEYHKKFSDVLGPKKTVRLYMAEIEFQQQLIRALRGNR